MRVLSLLVLSALLWSGCTTDFDVTADPEEKAVVYGIISQNDSIHYMRIQRSFLTESNALVAAGISDSIYFNENVTVTVTELRSNLAKTLTKVNADSVGLPKEAGIFAYDPAYLYRFERKYSDGDSVQIKIRKENSGKEWIARTQIVSDFDISVNATTRINLVSENNPYRLNWRSAAGAKVYDLIFRFHYLEWDAGNPSNKAEQFVDWLAFSGKTSSGKEGGELLNQQISGSGFFTRLSSQIETDPDKFRKIDSSKGLEIIMYAAGSEIYNFNRVREAQSGLLANEFLPSFTNVEGGGLGIFSSSYVKTEGGLLFTRSTVDSIACGQNTKDLNFKNSKGELGCD
ncbi:MAG: DUF4249 family protein [Chitinophagales bacterium]|nr:DUF4249 family protein [Chitinophagales bacterium]